MDCQLLDIIGTVQPIHVPPIDVPSFRLNLSQILQVSCLGQYLEDLLLHRIDVRRGVALAGHHSPNLRLVHVQPIEVTVVGSTLFAALIIEPGKSGRRKKYQKKFERRQASSFSSHRQNPNRHLSRR
jgi:hypothetical protein